MKSMARGLKIAWLAPAVAAGALLGPQAVSATPPDHTAKHFDSEWVNGSEFCTFPVAVHSVGDSYFTTFADGTFVVHSQSTTTYKNQETGLVLVAWGSSIGHIDPNGPGHDAGALYQLRDADGKLLAQYAGRVAVDLSPGEPGVTSATPNAADVLTPAVICTPLSGQPTL
jgi:hypothetical protein